MSMPFNSQEDAFAVAAGSEKRRYYFDIDDGVSITKDKEGRELEGLDSVRQEVVRALPEVVKDAWSDGVRRNFAIEVRDEAGQKVLRATFSLAVELLKNLP